MCRREEVKGRDDLQDDDIDLNADQDGRRRRGPEKGFTTAAEAESRRAAKEKK